MHSAANSLKANRGELRKVACCACHGATSALLRLGCRLDLIEILLRGVVSKRVEGQVPCITSLSKTQQEPHKPHAMAPLALSTQSFAGRPLVHSAGVQLNRGKSGQHTQRSLGQ